MVKLQSAKEMKIISDENYIRFQKEALESATFKRLVQCIEDAALNGHTRTVFVFGEDDSWNMAGIFQKVLRNSGYRVEVMFNNKVSIKWQ